MTPHQFIEVIYAMAIHDYNEVLNCVPAASYPVAFARPHPKEEGIPMEGQDSVWAIFKCWSKTAEAFIIYDHLKMVVMNYHTGRKIAKTQSIIVSGSGAFNHKKGRNNKSYPYSRSVVMREGLNGLHAYRDSSVAMSSGNLEVIVDSGMKRVDYVKHTNQVYESLRAETIFPRAIDRGSIVRDVYVEGEERDVKVAISEMFNKSIGQEMPAYLEPPPPGGRRTGNGHYNYCYIARPAGQTPGLQGGSRGPTMRGSVAGVSSDAAQYEKTKVYLPDMPYTQCMEDEATVGWIYCLTDFIKNNDGEFYSREVLDGELSQWNNTFIDMKKKVPNFAVCLLPAGSYFENTEERDDSNYVNYFMVEALSKLHITDIPIALNFVPTQYLEARTIPFLLELQYRLCPNAIMG